MHAHMHGDAHALDASCRARVRTCMHACECMCATPNQARTQVGEHDGERLPHGGAVGALHACGLQAGDRLRQQPARLVQRGGRDERVGVRRRDGERAGVARERLIWQRAQVRSHPRHPSAQTCISERGMRAAMQPQDCMVG